MPFLRIEDEAVLTADISLSSRRAHLPGDHAAMAERMQVGLQASDYTWRKQKLQMLWMSKPKADGQSEDKATAWLHENTRHLADVPQDILDYAIDEAAKTNRFLPDAAEVLAIANPILGRRKLCAARLREMARPDAQSEPTDEPERCSPEAAAAIIKEFGIGRRV